MSRACVALAMPTTKTAGVSIVGTNSSKYFFPLPVVVDRVPPRVPVVLVAVRLPPDSVTSVVAVWAGSNVVVEVVLVTGPTVFESALAVPLALVAVTLQ